MKLTQTKEAKMLAYHNDPKIKKKYVARIRAHQKADALVQGYGYWEDGKGCAVGCTIHGSDHTAYERELGIPVMLARLEDRIFEGLTFERAKKWPAEFLTAVKTGSDLSLVGWKFLHWLLTDQIKVVGEGKIFDDVRAAIKQSADVLVPLKEGGKVDKVAADAAADAAHAAAYAAYAAAVAAAYAAYASAHAAAYAADAADADAAAYAADASAHAAAYAADAADADAAAYAADAAADADADAAYEQMADKLLELIKEAPILAPQPVEGGSDV